MTTGRRVQVAGRGVYGRVVPLKPPKRKGWSAPRFGRLQWRGIGLVAGLLVIMWSISAFFAISDVRVQAPAGADRIETETRRLIGSTMWRANLLLLDTDALKTQLMQADPSLKTVAISRRPPHSLLVEATLKQPSLGWSTGNQVFVLDADGTVIGGLPVGSTLPVVLDGSNVPVKIGERAASKRFVDFASGLVPGLTSRGVQATQLSIGDTTLDLTAATNKGYRLIFDTGRAVDEELADYDAVMRTIVAQKRVVAEYIDLRIAGKAYYK